MNCEERMDLDDLREEIADLIEALTQIRNACLNGGEPEIDWIRETATEALQRNKEA